MSLQKNIEEQGAFARANRRFTVGKVVSRDDLAHTCVLDVGVEDAAGNPVYIRNVAYTPQVPPQLGDTVPILYGNQSPHSMFLGGGHINAQNTQDSITVVGGVTTIRETGESSGQKGDIELEEGSGVTITRTGKKFTFASTGGATPADAAPPAVASASALGSSSDYAREDHTHEGVHSLAKSGDTALVGDVTLSEGSNISLTRSGNDLEIAATGGEIVVRKNSGGNLTARPRLNFIEGTGVTIATNDDAGDDEIELTFSSDVYSNIITQEQSGGSYQNVSQATTAIYVECIGTSDQTQTLNTLGLVVVSNRMADNIVTVGLGSGNNFWDGSTTYVLYPGQTRTFVGIYDSGNVKYYVAPITTPQWIRLRFNYNEFSSASFTWGITIFTLPAKHIIHECVIKHSTAFSGGGSGSATISVGVSGSTTRYAPALNVFQAPGGTVAEHYVQSGDRVIESHSATTNIVATLTADVLTSAFTAGVVDIWLLVSGLP